MRASILSFPGTAAHLWYKKIDAKRRILVFQESFQLRYLLAQHVRRVTDASDDAETTGVGDCGCEFGTGGYVHAGEHDGVIDFEEVGDGGSELLWEMGLVFELGRGEGGDPGLTYVEMP